MVQNRCKLSLHPSGETKTAFWLTSIKSNMVPEQPGQMVEISSTSGAEETKMGSNSMSVEMPEEHPLVAITSSIKALDQEFVS